MEKQGGMDSPPLVEKKRRKNKTSEKQNTGSKKRELFTEKKNRARGRYVERKPPVGKKRTRGNAQKAIIEEAI